MMFYFNVLRYIWRHRKELIRTTRISVEYNESPMYQNYKDVITTDNDKLLYPLILTKFYNISSYHGDTIMTTYTIEKDEVEGILLGLNTSLYYIADLFVSYKYFKKDISEYFKAKRELKNRLKEISKSTRES